MQTCRQCGAEFLWALTLKGKSMPVDLEPNPDGNLATWRDVSGRLRCRVVTPSEPLEGYEKPAMPHFATCPGRAPQRAPLPPGAPIPITHARDARRRREFARRRGL